MTGPAKILVVAGMMGNCNKQMGSDASDVPVMCMRPAVPASRPASRGQQCADPR